MIRSRDLLLGGGASVTTGDTPPTGAAKGDLWWDSAAGVLFVWYVDVDSGQWVPATPMLDAGEGDGGGGGSDLDTTPVAPAGSTLARTMPDWLAGAPVIEIAGDVTITPDHRGAWLHMMNAVGSYIYLPDDWPVGMSFGARQVGTGAVQWLLTGDATLQLPFTRNTHVGISEQYEEVVFRVVANSDGNHAVWGVSGATA